MDDSDLVAMTAEQLRIETKRQGVSDDGSKEALLARLVRKRSEILAPPKNYSIWVAALLGLGTLATAILGNVNGREQIKLTQDSNELNAKAFQQNLKVFRADLDKQYILDWQSAIVYEILEKGCAEGSCSGMTFDEIKTRYVTEAASFKDIDIPKEAISSTALRRILNGFRATNVIWCTTDRRYYPVYVILQKGADKAARFEPLQYAILNFLENEKGTMDAAQICRKISEQEKVGYDEVHMGLGELTSLKVVLSTSDSKLYSRVFPPKNQSPEPPMTTKDKDSKSDQ